MLQKTLPEDHMPVFSKHSEMMQGILWMGSLRQGFRVGMKNQRKMRRPCSSQQFTEFSVTKKKATQGYDRQLDAIEASRIKAAENKNCEALRRILTLEKTKCLTMSIPSTMYPEPVGEEVNLLSGLSMGGDMHAVPPSNHSWSQVSRTKTNDFPPSVDIQELCKLMLKTPNSLLPTAKQYLTTVNSAGTSKSLLEGVWTGQHIVAAAQSNPARVILRTDNDIEENQLPDEKIRWYSEFPMELISHLPAYQKYRPRTKFTILVAKASLMNPPECTEIGSVNIKTSSKLAKEVWLKGYLSRCSPMNTNMCSNATKRKSNIMLLTKQISAVRLIILKLCNCCYTRFKTDTPAGSQETNINAGTQDHDSDSEVDEQVIVIMQKVAAKALTTRNMKAKRSAATDMGILLWHELLGGVSLVSASAVSDPTRRLEALEILIGLLLSRGEATVSSTKKVVIRLLVVTFSAEGKHTSAEEFTFLPIGYVFPAV
ncbi:hypothetical protein Tco_1428363 [Tanacetum coccineum]